MSDDDPLIPPIGSVPQAERLFRINWVAQLVRSPSGIGLLPAEFVARQGRTVRLIDVREPDELTGPLGHIPGSDWIPRALAPGLARRLTRDEPVVLISRGGERAGELAKQLERDGLRFVAALEGGMVSWKGLGFGTTRDPEILERRDQLRAPPAVAPSDAALTVERIERHVGDPGATRFLKLAALLLHGRMSCVDGRDDSSVVGTLGGDAGEFLLLLGAIERESGKQFTPAEVRALFARRLDALGRFYIHTDIHAANELIKSLRGDRRLDAVLANVFEAIEWRRFYAAPPPEVHEILLEHMLDPMHLGCGHVRLMWQNGERYGVRRGLTESFLRAFLLARWHGAIEAEFVPLGGGHAERGVLRVMVEQELQPFTPIPLVSPSCEGTQMFVTHPQVVGFLRRQLVAFALQQRALVPRLDPERLLQTLEEMAAVQTSATLGVLAKGLPIFDVTYSPGVWDVRHAGDVPA